MGSYFRYYKERQDADGVPLWWPGGPGGFPVRGQQPPQTTDAEYAKLQLSGKFRCRTFYLAKEEDLRDYILVRDKCSNQLYIPIDRDRQWDEETNDYRIYLEWLELGYDTPPVQSGATDAIRNYTKADTATSTLPYSRLAGVNKDW